MRIHHQIKYIILFIAFFLTMLFQTGCWTQHDQNRITYRLNKNEKERTVYNDHSHHFQEIENDIVRILSEADDRYLLMITPKMIKDIKKGAYVELIFSKEKKIICESLGISQVKVKKILLGLSSKYGWQKNGGCNIIIGTPSYKEFNIVVTSNPHISEKEFVYKINNLAN